MIFLLLLDVTAFLEITTLVFLINTAGILDYVIILKLLVALKQTVNKTVFKMCFLDQLFPNTHTHKCTGTYACNIIYVLYLLVGFLGSHFKRRFHVTLIEGENIPSSTSPT